MRKRKSYEKPAMQVFELKQQPQILAGSNGDGSLGDYNWNYPDEE
jgi:hypothetical protein